MRSPKSHLSRVVSTLLMFCFAAIALTGTEALARQDADANKLIAQHVDDFIHYVNIAQFDLAEAEANALLAMDPEPAAFVVIVEDSPTRLARFEQAYKRGLAVEQLEPSAAALWNLYSGGKLGRARDPNEIARNIALLTGDLRNKIYARERLKEAGEYAVPQLLETLTLRKDSIQLQSEIQTLFIEMGRHTVNPLSAALLGLSPEIQETACNILGRVGYNLALPMLYELRASTSEGAVRDAAQRAIDQLGGSANAPVSEAYAELAARYLDGRASTGLLSFPGEDYQLVWDFIPSYGLNATAVRTEVYHETRAMDLARHALVVDPANQNAVAVWLGANFSREIRQPEGWENPRWPADRLSPTYYAVAAGPTAVQRVLGESLDSRDTRLSRRAISALAASAGGAGLWTGLADRRPLLEALSYPDRRVRFEAALALANANPVTPFSGSERVVPILASAIRDAGTRYAVVIGASIEDQQRLRAALESADYEVLRPGSSLEDIRPEIARVPGVDIIIMLVPEERAVETMAEVRSDPILRATPVVVMLSPGAMARVGGNFDGDPLTRMAREGLNESQVAENAEQLVSASAGEAVSDDEATAYSLEALAALRNLAIGRNPVLRVEDAAPVLLGSLDDLEGQVRLHAAQVLSYVCDKRVQVALMDATLAESAEDQVAMLAVVTESAKRCGNLLDQRHVTQLLELVQSDDPAVATAAATLLGALNLPNAGVVPLIIDTK